MGDENDLSCERTKLARVPFEKKLFQKRKRQPSPSHIRFIFLPLTRNMFEIKDRPIEWKNKRFWSVPVDLQIYVSSSPCKSGSSPFDGRKKKKQPNKRRDRVHKETAASFCPEKRWQYRFV
ncbi:hypothetical protein CDAR_429201 [Caerostris darwini]|uniref:Uncharacterized protein n=1 Tax=Caerostris darwini TaxID=1538125 RepID=A0AAV4TH65_9ARAC|nr:hypothetical protein CDAR_429201 [Caerostris darwini]